MLERISRNRIWLRRLLLSYVTIFLFTVPLLIFALLMAFIELSTKNAIETNAIFTKQVLQSVDNQLQLIDNTITNEIATDDTLLAFFNPILRNDRYYSGYLTSLKVKSLMATMPLIDSIYMYRLADGTVQTPYSVTSLDAFIDKQSVADSLKQPGLNRTWSNVRKGYTEQGELSDFISLVRYVPLNSGNDGIILVNVKLQTLDRFLQSLTTAKSNHIRIDDRSGSPVYRDQSDNEPILTEMQSDYSGWTISSGMVDGNMFRLVSAISNHWLVVCVGFFLAGVLWVLAASKTRYKSYQSIVRRIQTFSHQKSEELFRRGTQDEYRFIDAALVHLMEQFHTFHKQHEEDLVYRRRHFFFEWIEGNRPLTEEKWRCEMDGLSLPHHFATICVTVVEISKYGKFAEAYSPHDQNLLKFILSSVVKEIAESANVTVWPEWTANYQLTVLYQFPTVSGEENPESVVFDLSKQLNEWVGTNLNFGITVGIGCAIDRNELVHDAYAEALKALQYKPSLGRDNIIGCWEIPHGGVRQTLDLLHYVRTLAYSLRTGKENWFDHFERLFEEIRAGMYTREELTNLMSYTTFFMQKEMMELSPDVRQLWTNSAYDKLRNAAEDWDSLDELEQDLRGLLTEFAGAMEELRENKSNYALIRNMKVYLEQHSANPDLSLHHLSDTFDFQMKNISRLFKEEIGENFIDYLTRIRIEHAKELLLGTDSSIQDITTLVGYLHPNTFIRSFKKLVGQTPGDYRKDARIRS